jgi:TonB family protein
MRRMWSGDGRSGVMTGMRSIRRPLVVSCALHAAFMLVALTVSRRPPEDPAGPAPAGVALDLPQAPEAPVVPVDVGGGGAASAPEPAPSPAAVVRARRARPAPARAAADRRTPDPPTEAPPPAPEIPAAPAAVEEGVAVAPAAQPDVAAGGAPAAAGEGAGTGEGDGTGDGVGSGSGAGIGLPGAGEMGKELHARVLGDEKVDLRPRPGVPILGHDEATALRERDIFPRLPESVWGDWRPYIVALEVCVGEDGRVAEAVLRSSASARLDPIVLEAVKTWRYRPRLRGGKPTPFCHGVVIKYDRW